jgi:glycosyltransferase involved in cell wall biosynthesis
MIISVCICTYNRCDILPYCLDSLRQIVDPRPRHDIEIIVVDNNSRDETRAVVEALIPDFPFKLRYIFEAQQGISAARNRAIDEASGDYLAFLDDECIVERDWLSAAIADIEEFRPNIVGGPYFGAFLPGDRPKWYKIEYGDAYFIANNYQKGFQKGFRASSGNMFVNRAVFENVKFDVNIGPVGDKLKLGEETDLQERFLRTQQAAESVFYDPGMVVRHFIRPEKMLLSYRARRLIAAGLSTPGSVSHTEFVVAAGKALAHTILSPFRCIWRDRARYPFWQNVMYERAGPAIFYNVGTAVRYLRSLFSR